MKKFLFIIIILSGIGIVGWKVYERQGELKQGVKQLLNPPVAVETVPIGKSNIQDVGNFTGSLYPASEFTLAPKIAGRLEKILVHIGDTVKSGQLIAVLDADEYLHQVRQEEAELDVAKANLQERKNILENAKREYERTLELRKNKIASESQLDAAESEYKTQQAKVKVAEAQVSQREAALMMAKVRLSYTQIRVPENHTAGYHVIGERFVDEGAMLAPNTPIASVLDIGNLIAAIHVIERDYTKIAPDLKAAVETDAFPGRVFSGKVIRIAPILKEKSREARVEIELPNSEKLLKPGMFARVQLQFDAHDNATVVPTSAIVKRDGVQGIFLTDNTEQKARFIPVTIGIISASHVEILNPPISGNVVTLGHHLLEDGSSILIPNGGGLDQRAS